ncbi:AraC family transcriptional regulator [Paenibacillus sp. 481]|uniref:AraC family transcriptional regulator n=1 Tax=Paenibacillus sp. 481 TaxID=2835869 RepID=UPI001E5DB8B5|nr:AraC family transcriptional regulator [Paenibacillus sp. 481]UHA73516.1 AraC family transcriptional regulator [Paenibacillus sp. 481]
MNFLNKLKYYTVYRKFYIMFILLVTLTVVAISSILFLLFYRSATREVVDISKSILAQTSYSAQIMNEQMLSVGNQMLLDRDINEVLFSERQDPITEFKALQKISELQSVYPFIRYVSLYNADTAHYIVSKGISGPYEDEMLRKLKASKRTDYLELFPRVVRVSPSQNYNLISFIFSLSNPVSMGSSGAIVVNVDSTYLQGMINGLGTHFKGEVFVMSERGTVLSHTSPDMFLYNYSKQQQFETVIAAKTAEGSYLYETDGQKKLITYIKSADTGWFFVSVQPYAELISNTAKLRDMTLWIAAVLIVLGLIIAFWLTNNVYNPIDSLMRKFSSINQSLNDRASRDEFQVLEHNLTSFAEKTSALEDRVALTQRISRKAYLQHYLQGNMKDFPNIGGIANDLSRHLAGPYFCVILLKIDQYSEIKQNNPDMTGLYRFAMNNISQEILAQHFASGDYICDDIYTGEDEVCILSQFSKDVQPSDLTAPIKQLQNMMNDYFKFAFSAGIGSVVSAKEDISYSFREAVESVRYRFFYGHRSILHPKLIAGHREASGKYPIGLEKKFIEALQLTDSAQLERLIQQFIQDIGHLSEKDAKAFIYQLTAAWIKHFQSAIDDNLHEFKGMTDRLSEAETLSEAGTHMRKLGGMLMQLLTGSTYDKNKSAVESVCKYMQEHYSKSDISLESMADKVKLSPGYLGKQFRKVCHMSFNEYLKLVRLEKSKELLATTNDSIATISEQIGIPNSTYFFTLFKKTYGLSPSQFRSQLAHNEIYQK